MSMLPDAHLSVWTGPGRAATSCHSARHIQGVEGVQFYTQQKMTMTRWFRGLTEAHTDPIWKTKAGGA
jgi:hypothetical protein